MKIGVDIGGTGIQAGGVNAEGKIVVRNSVPANAQAGYKAMSLSIGELINKTAAEINEKFPEDPAESVGIGVPGVISPDGATVVKAVNIFWENVPLKKDIEALTGLATALGNDATVAGVAENRFGATKGADSAAMYTVGTGVGGSLILFGHIVKGAHGSATEFGHMYAGDDTYTCNCGKNGCLETFSSATGLIKEAQRRIAAGEQTTILEAAGANPENINAKMVIDAAKAGDAVGTACFNRMTDKLAQNMAGVTDVVDPAVIAVGGGVSAAGDFLFDALNQKYRSYLTFPDAVTTKIVPAQFGNDAGIIGSAYIWDYLTD